MDYSSTLNLPKTDFPMKGDLPVREKIYIKKWNDEKIYSKLRSLRKNKEKYILHDGPPYANGNVHIGTALNKILKDIIVKYKSMKGFDSPYIPGWDCHGMPIEHQLLKTMNYKQEDINLLDFRKKCRDYALHYVNVQMEQFKRLGIFGEWEKPYLTLSNEYEANILKVFGELVRKKYIYRAFKPVLWCTNCGTALAEAEVEYEDYVSPSIYVKFKVKNPKGKFKPANNGTYFVIWTTTPWTLPANMALALNLNFMYCHVKTLDNQEELIIAQELIEDCMEKTGYKKSEYIVTPGAWSGTELEGVVCSHPWLDRDVETILGEHVTSEQGTGIVHTAPGHGREDYEIGLKYGLNIYAPVDSRGKFTEDVKDFEGQNVFSSNQGIIDLLKKKNALLGSVQEITHSYPHCWRCKKPVIFRATKQWFMNVDNENLRNRMLNIIPSVRWIPETGENRIKGMIESRPDWCLSRQRFWGIPIPALYCKNCKETLLDSDVIDKFKEIVLKESSDVWFTKNTKEFTEDKKCKKCGCIEFEKEKDILDVWFDSSISHIAVLKDNPELKWPADLYLEGSDQHRGWFQVSLITGVAIKENSPYLSVLTHGFTVDESGKKMSKSLGNLVTADETTKKYGADIIRLWVSSENYQNDVRFGDEILKRITETYRRIRNTLRFLIGNLYDFDTNKDKIEYDNLLEIDRFILHKLQKLIKDSTFYFDNFEFFKFYQAIHNFCASDLSSFYFDILKDRLYTFHSASFERKSAQHSLYKILVDLSKLLAPVLVFTAEEIWQYIPDKETESIHLSNWPNVDENLINDELEEKWNKIIEIRNMVLKSLEKGRNNKLITKSLEAKVKLKISKSELYEFLKNYIQDLPAIFIVSQVDIIKSDGEEDIGIEIEKADGSKCDRCWNYSFTVGTSKDHTSVCFRCLKVL